MYFVPVLVQLGLQPLETATVLLLLLLQLPWKFRVSLDSTIYLRDRGPDAYESLWMMQDITHHHWPMP